MAGNLNSTSVHWQVGDSTGHNDAGQTVAVPGNQVSSGTAAPSGAPSGSPFYVNTTNNKLYAWTGSAWVAISGANT